MELTIAISSIIQVIYFCIYVCPAFSGVLRIVTISISTSINNIFFRFDSNVWFTINRYHCAYDKKSVSGMFLLCNSLSHTCMSQLILHCSPVKKMLLTNNDPRILPSWGLHRLLYLQWQHLNVRLTFTA